MGSEVLTKEQALLEAKLKVARHVLWWFGDPLGEDGGGFVTRLLNLISIADRENRAKIAAEWPEYVAGFVAAQADIEPVRVFVKGARRG